MFLLHLCSTLALLAPQEKHPRAQAVPPPAPKVMEIVCTPNTITCKGEQLRETKNSIAAALTRAAPGAQIHLEPGDYHGFDIGFAKSSDRHAQTSGGTKSAPITIVGKGRVLIKGEGNAISIRQEIKNGYITFKNIEIWAGQESGVSFAAGDNWVHEGYRFVDCDIIGPSDPASGTGSRSKWGVYGRGLKDFEFRGLQKRVRIVDLRSGDAFCLQNLRGNVLIENVDVARVGRTFIRLTAESAAGSPGAGLVTVRNCSAEDCCIGSGDDDVHGAAFTFAGRHEGTILLQGNRVRAGFVPELHKSAGPESAYGTGALVVWDGNQDAPTTHLILEDNDFEMFKGCGDRPLVAIGACRSVSIRGQNRFVAGANPAALELEPIRKQRPQGSPVGALSIDPGTVISGPIRWRGTELSLEELQSKLPRVADPPPASSEPSRRKDP